jgi:hypothetical protein
MKNKFFASIIAVAMLFGMAACTSDFDTINKNPDTTSEVTNNMLVTQLLSFLKPGNMAGSINTWAFSKHVGANENGWGKCGLQYNSGVPGTDFSTYTELNNTLRLKELATGSVTEDTYLGFSLWVKAYRLFELTMWKGDIPYSEAFQGEEGLTRPKYDTQQEVFRQLIADLDAAYNHFVKASVKIEGDFTTLGGDLDKWKRIVNLTELRVLINLSKRADDTPDLNAKAKFAEVAARPLLRDRNDDLALKFVDGLQNQLAIWAPDRTVSWYNVLIMASEFFEKMLKKYDDRRLFYFFNPADAKLEAGVKDTDPSAYVGGDTWMPSGEFAVKSTAGEFSRMHDRYRQHAAEPWIHLGYTQQCFILAEAALRGWISGSASDYYNAGIRSGMEFTAENDDVRGAVSASGFPSPQVPAVKIDETYIKAHLASNAVKLTGNFDSDLLKILEQKYIAHYMQFENDPYFDYRRTGLPALPNNPTESLNILNPNEYPWRGTYPGEEATANLENLNEAVQRQFGGSDDVSQKMWLIK